MSDSHESTPQSTPTEGSTAKAPEGKLPKPHGRQTPVESGDAKLHPSLANRHPATRGIHPTPGRCNRHLNAFLLSLYDFDDDLKGTAKAWWACIRSEVGQEPPLYQGEAFRKYGE
ncbi:hypothetical protein IWQ60_003532 [Tieghemiomyces parasiticus]|uniref:Uncharacterized protein n=1 Tax=Tieghemiomyces parasiticus TaxID=78921 RepID=A0A9W8E056_9FUNG|nr:hypothetical protein IWQ60_003532 [Tieghemiomyces parasiticus]